MALTWAGCTGFGHVLPWLYPAFFITMIVHRYKRDQRKCEAMYGEDWKRYVTVVPWAFIPYVV